MDWWPDDDEYFVELIANEARQFMGDAQVMVSFTEHAGRKGVERAITLTTSLSESQADFYLSNPVGAVCLDDVYWSSPVWMSSTSPSPDEEREEIEEELREWVRMVCGYFLGNVELANRWWRWNLTSIRVTSPLGESVTFHKRGRD